MSYVRNISIFITLLFTLLIIAENVEAAEYYVATNGSDSNNGSQASPWKTFQKAVDKVAGGDTVYFRAGAYAGGRFTEKHPQAGQWITFKPYAGEKATIDSGQRIVDSNGKPVSGISISGASYIIIEGFEVTNKEYPQNLVHSCNLQDDPNGSCRAKAEDLRGGGATGISLSGTYSGNAKSDNHHIIIRNNEIHHNISYGIIAGGRTFGTTGQHDIQIVNNHFHHNGIPGLKEGYGTYLKGTRLIVSGNIAHHNTGNNFRFATLDHVGTDELIDSVIENNISYATEGPWLHAGQNGVVDAGAGIVIWGGINNVIRNNLVFNTRGMGMFMNGVDPAKPDMIYNNTVYGNGTEGLSLVKNVVAKNNIVFGNAKRKPAYEIMLFKNSRAENNLVGGSQLMIDTRDSSTESNNIKNSDPKFVNPAAGDFGLQEGSPALDKGITLAAVPKDFTGKARPEGAAYDLGAFEGAGSRANAFPAVGGGITPIGGAGGTGGGSLGLGNCLQ